MSAAAPVPLIDVCGSPAEWGAAYGAQAAGRIATNLAVYRDRFAVQAGLDAAAVHAAGATFRAATAAHHPPIAQALDAVAEGAGLAVEEIYALNARTELLYGTAAADECTSIGVLGTHTAGGGPLLAQNWDWHPDQRDAMVLLRTVDDSGFTVLTLAEAGMLAKTGLNSAGLGLLVNMLGCDRDGLGVGRPVGVPYHVMLRAALEAGSLGAALKATIRPARNSSINLMLGQGGPDGGEIIDVELVPGDAAWLNPVGGLLTHANHLDTPLAVHDTIKDWGGSSPFRAARARRLLEPAAADRKITEDELIAVLRDHGGYPSGICRHVDDSDPPVERSESVYSVVLDLDGRRMALAEGPPCQFDYTWCEL